MSHLGKAAPISAGCFLLLTSIFWQTAVLGAQSPVISLSLVPDQIGLIKTGPGIATRLTFPDEVTEIICGDLYDSTSGKGNFVVQRSANDVFVKPVAAKGFSNLFVKTGKDGTMYSFDLVVVSVNEAYRIVNVSNGRNARVPGVRIARPPQIQLIQITAAPAGVVPLSAPVIRVPETTPPPMPVPFLDESDAKLR
jgi:hypothetical protein